METSASYEARSAPLSYPTIVHRCDADAVRLAEGSTWDDRKREGRPEIAGVPSSGHVFKGISQEPRRAHHLRSQGRKRGRQGRPEATAHGWMSSLTSP
jgi:hypothetical protein